MQDSVITCPFKFPRGGDPVTVPRELDAPPAAPFESVCKLVKVPNGHRVSVERLNVQPQAARAYYCEFELPSRADWRLQRCVSQLPLAEFNL